MCGIIGITDRRDAAQLAYLGLFSLQHRGQESAGIVTTSRGELKAHLGMGLVADVFEAGKRLSLLPGRTAIGHVRYATTGASHIKNAQPLIFSTSRGPLAIGHNGNLTNAAALKTKLEERGAIFQSSTDSEVIVHLIARHKGPLEDAIIHSLRQVEGAYSLLFLSPEKLIAVRDPMGFRPLVLGRIGNSFVFASETCALRLLKAKFVRELAPGEMVVVEGKTLKTLRPFAPAAPAQCVFEHIYFARPDSNVFGQNVHLARRELGRELAREMRGVKADFVVPCPDSGIAAALGFSQESGIPLEMGLIRNHYVGRSFIQPEGQRSSLVELKLHPVEPLLKGRSIVLVDDSIVRGTTSRRIVRLLKETGARQVHMAISSPPIVSPCYYGIDTPEESQLIASSQSPEEIRKFLGADSLTYLSLEGMRRAVARGERPAPPAPGSSHPDGRGSYCNACFTRDYPTSIPKDASEEILRAAKEARI